MSRSLNQIYVFNNYQTMTLTLVIYLSPDTQGLFMFTRVTETLCGV